MSDRMDSCYQTPAESQHALPIQILEPSAGPSGSDAEPSTHNSRWTRLFIPMNHRHCRFAEEARVVSPQVV